MSTDAAILRAAAAIVEAQEERRPHLVSLRNRLLSLARELAVEAHDRLSRTCRDSDAPSTVLHDRPCPACTALPEPEPEDA